MDKFFRFDYDSENLKGDLFYKGRKIIIGWEDRLEYQATFHLMQIDGIQPFHYFIVLPGKNPTINYKVLKKIDKAVTKVKRKCLLNII